MRVEAVDGAAARAGVREGDVILSIDNTEVDSAKQFEAVVAKLDKARPVSVLVRRGEWVNYLVIRPLVMQRRNLPSLRACKPAGHRVFPRRGTLPNCSSGLISESVMLECHCCLCPLTSMRNDSRLN